MLGAATEILKELAIELPEKSYQFDKAMYEILNAFECNCGTCDETETFEDFHAECEKNREKIRFEHALYTPKGRG